MGCCESRPQNPAYAENKPTVKKKIDLGVDGSAENSTKPYESIFKRKSKKDDEEKEVNPHQRKKHSWKNPPSEISMNFEPLYVLFSNPFSVTVLVKEKSSRKKLAIKEISIPISRSKVKNHIEKLKILVIST